MPQLTVNQLVAGSSPARGASSKNLQNLEVFCFFRAKRSGSKVKLYNVLLKPLFLIAERIRTRDIIKQWQMF